MPSTSARNAQTFARLRGIPKRIGSGLSALYRDLGHQQEQDVQSRFSGRPGLISRSGTLQGSLEVASSGGSDLNTLRTEVYSKGTSSNTLTGQGYARLQEFGGTITPKHAQMLTIPLSSNVGSDGLPKYRSAADMRALGLTKLILAADGNYYILVKEGSDWNPMWVLKESVYVPPRLRFYDSFEARKSERKPQIDHVIVTAINGGK